ncbi:hypothetical protein BJP37_23050 [Moorena bouillonii PNG]|uniref:Uncharacterized protein n=1 Tax=Moorena bouillonii PNG TaxID=568701 RepID=A0A1U7N684_9CYAN|nr:hypothetical protein BJP37_23050 [Moorena bouillonii PNG]
MGKNLQGASQCMQLGKNSHTSDTSRSPHTLLLFYKNRALLHKEYELAAILFREKNLARPSHDRSFDQDPIEN